jgi:hypothetical protein
MMSASTRTTYTHDAVGNRMAKASPTVSKRILVMR